MRGYFSQVSSMLNWQKYLGISLRAKKLKKDD